MSESDQSLKQLAKIANKGVNRRTILRNGLSFPARRALPITDSITPFSLPDNSSNSGLPIDPVDAVDMTQATEERSDVFSPQDVHEMLKGMIEAVWEKTGVLTGLSGAVESYFYDTDHFPIDTDHSVQLSRQSGEHPRMPDSTSVNFYEQDEYIGSVIYTDRPDQLARVWVAAAENLPEGIIFPEGASVLDYNQALAKWKTLTIPENHVLSVLFLAMKNTHQPTSVSEIFRERILDVFDLPGLEAAKLDFLNQGSTSLYNPSRLTTEENILSRIRKINTITGTLKGAKDVIDEPDYQILTPFEVHVLFERPLALAPGHIPQTLSSRITSSNIP